MLLTATEIIQNSWRDYRERFHDWMVFSLLIFLPTFIITLVGSFGMYLNTYVPSTVYVTNLFILIISLISLVFGFWTTLALIHAGGDFLKNRKIEFWKDHYAAVIPNLWPGIYTSLFVALLVLLGTILFLIPGIIFLVWYYFAIYVVVLDNKKGWTAMKESRELVRGRWWATAWRLFAPNVVFGAAVVLIQFIFSSFFDVLPISLDSILLLKNVVNTILSALLAPITTLIVLYVYNSLKEEPLAEPAPAEIK